MSRDFYVVIERDEDGVYVGEVPQLKACYSQGHTIDIVAIRNHSPFILMLKKKVVSGMKLLVCVDLGIFIQLH